MIITPILRPAWQGTSVFAADRKGLVKAMDADTGKQIWQTDLSEKTNFLSSNHSAMLSGGVTASGSHVYVGSEKAVVYALNAYDGQVAWQTVVAGEALSRPVVSDGVVLIHTSNGMLQALNESDGAIKWTLIWIRLHCLCVVSQPLRLHLVQRLSVVTMAGSVQ